MDLEEIDLKLDVYFIIKQLLEESRITSSDLEVIDLYFSGFSTREIAMLLNRDWRVVGNCIRDFIYNIRERYNNEILCDM